MSNQLSSVELHIEELVLHGFAPGDRYGIGEAAERELTRMFREQGLPASFAQSGEIEHVDGGAFDVGANARPEVIGAQIARAIYDGLKESHER